ncbi:hypothetical protein [Halosimplex marinum]|uniref:hypothetical protein n=1 Tax=Halosimplex marinum TaxID=3396620 RepID=UPI003F57DA08
MKRTTLHRVLAFALGAGTGAGLWRLGTEPGVAAAGGIALLVLGLVASRLVRDHPEFTSASGNWRDNRWSAAGQVFVILVAFQAVFAAPVEFPDEVGLLVVVLGTYMVGYVLGGLDALERGRGEGTRQPAGNADPADD